QIVTSLIHCYLNSLYSGRFIDYSLSEQIRDVYPHLLISLAMTVIMHLAGGHIASNLLRLFVQLSVGILMYLVVSYIITRPALYDVLRLARRALEPATESRAHEASQDLPDLMRG